MRLSALIKNLATRRVGGNGADPEIRRVRDDSRLVEAGDLFVARRGVSNDGAEFVTDAIRRGAAGVLVAHETRLDGVWDATVIEATDPLVAGARMALRLHGDPHERMTLIAATGTNGKTTVVSLIRQLLSAAGVRCGLVGTVELHDGARTTLASMTTPGAIELAETLGRFAGAGCQAVVLEASSHGIEQGRLTALDFDCAVFTNLSGDHLDYHGSMEAYASAKAKLFESLGSGATAVVNADDSASERMLRDCAAEVIACSLGSSRCELRPRWFGARSVAPHWCCAARAGEALHGGEVELVGPWGVKNGRCGLVGRHNLMNLLQAVAAAHAVGAPSAPLCEALPALTAPGGRLERLGDPHDGPSIFVDYAHTDDALRHALQALRPLVPDGGRLWVVFGCGGERDATKRPRMGETAGALADVSVLTSDNPRREDPEAILDQIEAGMGGSSAAIHREADRRKAIEYAIGSCAERDLVLIAGKGHEREQVLPDGDGGVVKRAFDDREEARRALRSRSPARKEAAA